MPAEPLGLLGSPALTTTGPCDIVLIEAIPGGPLDVFGDSTGPLPEHLQQVIGAASQISEVAGRLAHAFVDPDDFYDWLTPDGAQRYLGEMMARHAPATPLETLRRTAGPAPAVRICTLMNQE